MTKEQYVLQNKDLRTRIENMRIARQMSEDSLKLQIQELALKLRSKDEQIQMLQSYIASREEVYRRVVAENTDLEKNCAVLSEKCESFSDAVNMLTARINKDSRNSSKPPATSNATRTRRAGMRR